MLIIGAILKNDYDDGDVDNKDDNSNSLYVIISNTR